MVVLLISYSDELFNGEPAFVMSNCHPVKALHLEPAGHSFHSAALKSTGYCEEVTETDSQSVSSDGRSQGSLPSSGSHSSEGKKYSRSYTNKGKNNVGRTCLEQDHYALLGLEHLRYMATEEQIRKSYRDAALKHHPDKQASLLLAEATEKGKQAKKEEIESRFKSIHEAYEVLIDPLRRRIYDSTDEFDDAIPIDCAPGDFFEVFGLTFLRNGKWSSIMPVPSLGEENTPMNEVDHFYDFWYSFKSWREFPHDDEYDLEEAESREEKRWMERQNAKLREKANKVEHRRIRALVESAYKKDPRILKRKEDEKAEKKRKKDMKSLGKRLQEEEARRIAEEERIRKEEEEKQAAEAAKLRKKLKEKEKRLLRKEKARLRALFAPVVSKKVHDLSDDDVEQVFLFFEMEQLKLFCDDVSGKEDVCKALILKQALRGEKVFLPNGLVSDKMANGH